MAQLRAPAATMRHIRAGLDVVGEDLVEMERRVEHPQGRRGYRMRELSSELGIPGYLKETITIYLPKSTTSRSIVITHEAPGLKLSCSVSCEAMLHVVDKGDEYPEAVVSGMVGRTVGEFVDICHTSFAECSESRITALFRPSKGWWIVYFDAQVESIPIPELLEEAC